MNGDKQNELAMKKWLHLPAVVLSHMDADSYLDGTPIELKSAAGTAVQIGRDINFKFYRKYIASELVVGHFKGNRITEMIFLPRPVRVKVLAPLYSQLMLRARVVKAILAAKPIILPLLWGKVSEEDFVRALEDMKRVRQFRVPISTIKNAGGITLTSHRHFRKLVKSDK